MSKYFHLINLIFFISSISIIFTEETKTEKKSNKKWTAEALIKYTLKNHGKEKYFICDPLGYITDEEKEVIYYRLETIYNKLNITSVFFILDKISMDGLNITSIDNDDEFEDDEIVYNKDKTENNTTIKNATINGTMGKTEEEKKREFQIYISEVKKKLFNRKIFLERESKCLIGIYTVEEVGKYLYVGKDYRDLVNEPFIVAFIDIELSFFISLLFLLLTISSSSNSSSLSILVIFKPSIEILSKIKKTEVIFNLLYIVSNL